MSQGGEVSTQQLVYGPDGKVYGNPALARAAGVNQTYREDGTPYPETMLGNLPLSPSVPITEAFDPSAGIGEFERRQFLPNQPVPVPSQYQQVMGQTGGATPYQRIMAQMTPTMNPYGSVSGGYDPSFQGGYDPGLYSRLTRSGLINTGGMGGGGGGGGGSDYSDPNPAWSNMTQAERAAYYAANPTMASVTRGLQGLFGNTLYGKIQNYFNPNFVTEEGLIAMGVNPATYQAAKESFRASEIAAMNAGYPSYTPSYETGVGIPGESYTGGFTSSETGVGNPGESYGGPTSSESGIGNPGESYGGGPTSSDTGAGNPGESGGGNTSSDTGAGNPGESYYMGGLVNSVGGSDPAGPDEGQINIMRGEYVIKKSAVKKYGKGLLDMINDGKIPAKKMKSLLG